MELDYIIKNVESVSYEDIQELLIELKQYRKTYGKIPSQDFITVTKSNLSKERINIKDIIRYTQDEGFYEGVKYNTEIYCKDKTYYVVDTVMEISEQITNKSED